MSFRTCAKMNDAQFETTKLGNAAVKLRGRDRKTTFGESGKKLVEFSENSSVLHPCFLLFMGKAFLRSRPQVILLWEWRTVSASSAAFPLENP